jgi:hypothetical protein
LTEKFQIRIIGTVKHQFETGRLKIIEVSS